MHKESSLFLHVLLSNPWLLFRVDTELGIIPINKISEYSLSNNVPGKRMFFSFCFWNFSTCSFALFTVCGYFRAINSDAASQF
uniref:Uncharacterized protein n=1 Tax=Caenorhabditis japonica TaxID=281687 RepID=A0A8R1IPF6_CAEJA